MAANYGQGMSSSDLRVYNLNVIYLSKKEGNRPIHLQELDNRLNEDDDDRLIGFYRELGRERGLKTSPRA